METTIIHWGSIGIMEKTMETTIAYWRSREEKMETTIVYWGSIGITEKEMETTNCLEGQEGIVSMLSCKADNPHNTVTPISPMF